ncbi:MAG: hypothetical protein JRI97_07720 [Deltaproteobacteria bacterium]|nr:hypothetical protein [Deltaproteobacteria bacterium]
MNDARTVPAGLEKRITQLRDLHRAYRRVFMRRGAAKEVLRDLERRTYLNGTRFHPDMVNPAENAIFQEGRRSVGLHIRFMLDPENFTDEALLNRARQLEKLERGEEI